ncbi:hypothetical protein ACOMHN_041759 [Nucella lapillus]
MYAPCNVTATADINSIHVTWRTPPVIVTQPDISKYLEAFRVWVLLENDHQTLKDLWVPLGIDVPMYRHKVTCLTAGTAFSVRVLAVYRSDKNISQDVSLSLPVDRTTKEKSWWSDVTQNPVSVVVGAALMLLIVLIVLPLICLILHKVRSRRRLLRINSSDSLQNKRHRKHDRTRYPSITTLPSVEQLQNIAMQTDYHLTPVPVPVPSSAYGSSPRAIQPANQRSPLMKFSPPSTYQTSSSVPSEVAPSRPGEDEYELEDNEDYENVLMVNTAAKVFVKSTSFSGVSGLGVKVPVPINGDKDNGDEDEDADENDYMNNVYGRRCATMPSKVQRGKGVKKRVEKESIYGNC